MLAALEYLLQLGTVWIVTSRLQTKTFALLLSGSAAVILPWQHPTCGFALAITSRSISAAELLGDLQRDYR